LILAGVCLLVNKKTRTAATSLGLTILLTVLWIDLPMLLAAPTDVVALNFFFDTLLFCGAILLVANSIDKEPASKRWSTGRRHSFVGVGWESGRPFVDHSPICLLLPADCLPSLAAPPPTLP
jgi:hypothetical protein